MGLSSDLISQFVKITKDNHKSSTETTVYGTAVRQGGSIYVRLDGSDLLTPASTTTNVADGERVIVMIKNHSAIITGNVSSPAARTEEVTSLSQQVVEASNKILEFGTVVTDVVTTKDLDAERARIDVLEANDLTVTDELTVHKASIEQLEAKNIDISEKLTTRSAEIDDLKANKLDVVVAEMTYATIEGLTATEANIVNLKATYGEFANLIADNFTASNAVIENLNVKKLDVETANITFATIENLTATNAKITNLEADQGEFKNLVAGNFEAINGTIENLDSTFASIEYLNANYANVGDLKATYATIENLNAATGRISTLETNSLTADSAVIKNLTADVADIDTLIFGSATGNVIQSSFANAVIAQLGNAQIKSAMIESVSAGKITAGDIITNNVRVMSEDGSLLISDETIQISDDTRVRVQIGKDAAGDYSISIWDASGKLMFSEGGITDSAIKQAIIRNDMVSNNANISASKLDINSLFEEINGSAKTIKSSKVYLDDEKQTLDVAFTAMTSEVGDLSSSVSSQGTAISVMQGQISSKIWQQDIENATNELEETTNTLSTKYSSLEQSVNGISSTVASHTSQIANKADNSTVTTVSEKVSGLEQSLDGFQTSVGSTYATKVELKETDDELFDLNNKVYLVENTATNASNKATTAQNTATTALTEANRAIVQAGTLQADLNAVANRVTTAETSISQNTEQIALRATKSELESTNAGIVDAQNTANEAKANAATAQTAAEEAASAAELAQQAADDADEKAQQAAADLETAKTNLADVTSRVGATEEDIAAAEQAVVNAQTAANNAATAAQNAQSTANTAKTNAANAQTAANNAKKAADEAQADVDALTTRVTTAETNISQNAEAIALRATKTEVAKTLEGYYTSAQTDAAITIKANAITSSVSETYATKSALNTTNTNVTDASNAAKKAQDDVDALETNVSTNYATKSEVTQTANSITSSVSSTYATKSALNTTNSNVTTAQNTANNAATAAQNAQADVDTLERNVSTNYATKSEVQQTANSITSSVESTYQKTVSKGEQLVTNGNGLMGNNTNFSTWTFDGAIANNSSGSFTKSAGSVGTYVTDEFFPVNPDNEYTFSLDVKSLKATGKMYSMLMFYDADKNQISAGHHIYSPASATTLARDLKAGDTVIYLTNSSGWSTTYVYGFYMVVWNYKNKFGYTYPSGTYSRTRITLPKNGNYLNSANLNKTNHTITLTTAYSGATIPAGTEVSQGGDGATYKYFPCSNTTVPTTWTNYSGKISGVDYSGQNKASMFPPATAYAKLGFLWNYSGSGNGEQFWITNLVVTDTTAVSAAQNAVDALSDTITTNYATKSEVQQTANSITSSVSSTYATKSALNTTNSNVTNAANAAKKAQDEVDALETNVSTNYATKSEVTQTANSITSSVSSTYATKTDLGTTNTNVTNAANAAKKAQDEVDALETNVSSNYATKSEVQQTANSITSSVSSTYAKKTIPDTRSNNESPEWYITNYPKQSITEFKYCNVIGLSGEVYCALTTVCPWGDRSGGYPKQTAEVAGKMYWRVGTSDTTWGDWNDALGSAVDAATAAQNAQTDATSALTRVSQTESSITSQAAEIDDLGGRMSTVEQTASGLTVSLQTTNSNVMKAQTAANNAQSTANTAVTNAATAQSTANSASSAASTAQSTADTAKKIANAGAKRINTHMRNFTKANWQNYGVDGHSESWTTGASYDNTHIAVGDIAYIVGKVSDAGGSNDVHATIYGKVTSVSVSSVVMTSQYYIMGGEGGAYALANTANTNAANAAKTATNYMNFSNGGLTIGDMTASTLGNNVLIDSDSVDIRNGATTLASYSANKVQLGMNSTNSIIELCGGIGTISYGSNFITGSGQLMVKSDQATLFGNRSALVASGYSNNVAGGSARYGSIAISRSHIEMNTNECDMIEADGSGIWHHGTFYIDPYDIYGLADEVHFVGRDIMTLETVVGAIQLKPTSHVSVYSDMYVQGDLVTSNPILANGGIVVPNNGSIFFKSTAGTDMRMITLNDANEMFFGYNGYSSNIGKSYFDGNEVYIRSKNGISMTGSLTTTGNITMPNNMSFRMKDTGGTARSVIYLNNANNIVIGKGMYDISDGITNVYGYEQVGLWVNGETVALLPSSNAAYTGFLRPKTNGTCCLGDASHKWYAVYANNASIQTSDVRDKENIYNLNDDIHSELFDRLKPVQFNYLNFPDRICYGLIAQEVAESMEELGIGENELDLIHHDYWIDEDTNESKESYGLAYNNLIAMLIYEVQKLKREVSALKAV